MQFNIATRGGLSLSLSTKKKKKSDRRDAWESYCSERLLMYYSVLYMARNLFLLFSYSFLFLLLFHSFH